MYINIKLIVVNSVQKNYSNNFTNNFTNYKAIAIKLYYRLQVNSILSNKSCLLQIFRIDVLSFVL